MAAVYLIVRIYYNLKKFICDMRFHTSLTGDGSEHHLKQKRPHIRALRPDMGFYS